jgi:hypothetical protein
LPPPESRAPAAAARRPPAWLLLLPGRPGWLLLELPGALPAPAAPPPNSDSHLGMGPGEWGPAEVPGRDAAAPPTVV